MKGPAGVEDVSVTRAAGRSREASRGIPAVIERTWFLRLVERA